MKQIQIGDTCSVIKRFLHPSKLISERYPNQDHRETLEGLLVTGFDNRSINRATKQCVLFRHEDFENKVLYCSTRYARITNQAHREQVNVNEEEDTEELVEVPTFTGNNREDTERLRVEGYNVDDDNDPAPENVPVQNEPNNTGFDPTRVQYHDWNSKHFCNRRHYFNHFENASIKPNQKPLDNARIDWFLRCIPSKYIQDVVLTETNKKLGRPMDYPELLRFLGLLFLMSTARVGCSIRSWFEETEPSKFEGAPFRLQEFMSRTWFEEILRSLTYTNVQKPTYKDKFWQVRQMILSWNENMNEFFCPSWVSCLDESMSIWTNRWTCPGWTFVPRKPHPFGNEYHTIACGKSGILYGMEMVEGKDAPPEIKKDFDEMGRTVALLLRLTKNIWTTGKVVILDSGFCVLRGLIELFKKGVFGSALIKKRRFWPKDVPGEAIIEYFGDKPIGYTARRPGTSYDNVNFDIFALKEKEYTCMIMSTYGALNVNHNQKLSYRAADQPGQPPITFYYTEVFGNHFQFRGAVDQHNGKRHDGHSGAGMSFEESWATNRWENRVFAYILATSEINAYLCRSYFGGSAHETQFEFRQKLCFDLIHYETERINAATPVRTRSVVTHKLIKVPAYSKFFGGTWVRCYKQKYQQHFCAHQNCKQRTRTVCTCSKDVYRCVSCFSTHRVEEVISPQVNDGNQLFEN
jgi:hypothetical protein